MRRGGLRFGAATGAALAAVVVVVACEDPTEVTLVITTDVDCSTAAMYGTTITVGTADDIQTKAPVAVTSLCSPSGTPGVDDIGTFVVVPSAGRSASFAVRIVTGVSHQATLCAPGGGQTPNYDGCIVALRELAFVPHTPLTLPITMSKVCDGYPCPQAYTCVDRGGRPACVSDQVNSSGCKVAGSCGDLSLPDDGGLEDASEDSLSPEATPGDATGTDAPELDAPIDGPVDSPGMDAPQRDAPITDVGSMDVVMSEAAPKDATGIDSTVPDASGADAPVEAAQEASIPDSSGSGDGSILGGCPAPNSSAGVTCGGATCASGDVCCVGVPSAGSPTYACTTPGSCDTSATGSTTYSALACRNLGDCTAGTVCCLVGGTVGGSFTTSCQATCSNFTRSTTCRNLCECNSVPCTVPSGAAGIECEPLGIATCGGTCL